MSRVPYPFAQQYVLSNRRDDEVDSYYLNSSTTRLAGAGPFVDHSGYLHFILLLSYMLTHTLQEILDQNMVVLTILQATLTQLHPAFLPLQT